MNTYPKPCQCVLLLVTCRDETSPPCRMVTVTSMHHSIVLSILYFLLAFHLLLINKQRPFFSLLVKLSVHAFRSSLHHSVRSVQQESVSVIFAQILMKFPDPPQHPLEPWIGFKKTCSGFCVDYEIGLNLDVKILCIYALWRIYLFYFFEYEEISLCLQKK